MARVWCFLKSKHGTNREADQARESNMRFVGQALESDIGVRAETSGGGGGRTHHISGGDLNIMAGMQIHIRPVARGDKNYVRAIVNQHVTSPAGD